MKNETLTKLKEYFETREDVDLAFLFGSQSSGRQRISSDWDIAVYFKSPHGLELESTDHYAGEETVHAEVERLVETEVDLVVLNRARPPLVFSILNTGIPLNIKDRSLYLNLLTQTHYEAVDFWKFVEEFWRIREQATKK